jgi:hypothetical protein
VVKVHWGHQFWFQYFVDMVMITFSHIEY